MYQKVSEKHRFNLPCGVKRMKPRYKAMAHFQFSQTFLRIFLRSNFSFLVDLFVSEHRYFVKYKLTFSQCSTLLFWRKITKLPDIAGVFFSAVFGFFREVLAY